MAQEKAARLKEPGSVRLENAQIEQRCEITKKAKEGSECCLENISRVHLLTREIHLGSVGRRKYSREAEDGDAERGLRLVTVA